MKVRKSTFISIDRSDSFKAVGKQLSNVSRVNAHFGGRNFVLGMSPERAIEIGKALARAGRKVKQAADRDQDDEPEAADETVQVDTNGRR